jgi:hypothetical protein
MPSNDFTITKSINDVTPDNLPTDPIPEQPIINPAILDHAC